MCDTSTSCSRTFTDSPPQDTRRAAARRADGESALVFNIQRASTHDGPGLRTTVFLKGCNLRCLWCHNPESWSAAPQVEHIRARCVGCGACETVCPRDGGDCIGCGLCEAACVSGARVLMGREMSIDAVMGKVLPDAPFYRASGGGVTFSGGEPMLQIAFLRRALRKCREAGIHTAVDSAGDVPWALYESLLADADLFLYDIKCADPALHRRVTGADNARIKGNLSRLIGAGKRVIVRVPILPGVNDSDAELSAISQFVREARPAGVELLPYHMLGAHKYESLGMENRAADIVPPTDREMDRIRREYRWN